MSLRLVFFVFLLAEVLAAQGGPDAAGIGRKAFGLLAAGRYVELVDMFTPEMRSQLSEDRLRSEVGPQMHALGAVEKIGEPVLQPSGGLTVAAITVKFSSASIDWRFTVNREGKIAGLFFQPAAAASAADWQRPPYSHPEAFRDREVTVGDAPWKLPATLTVPVNLGGAVPGIVLVHGSGPEDRDATIGPNKPFRDLAEGLASRGIAVLRYEKRTKVYSARMTTMKDLTVEQETIDDAVKAAALLRAEPEIASSRVFVLGHSLGGYVAPRIAQQNSRLSGVVLMAANVRPLEAVIEDQLQSMGLTGADLQKAKADILKGIPPAYLEDLRNYNPVDVARTLSLPLLILQGERDYQVTMKDFNLWRAGLADRANITFRSFPALNHLFMAGQGRSTPAEYAQAGHVDEEVIEMIARWVRRR